MKNDYYLNHSKGKDFWLGLLIGIVASGLAMAPIDLPSPFELVFPITILALTVLAGLYFIILGNRRFFGIGMLIPSVILLIVFGGCFYVLKSFMH